MQLYVCRASQAKKKKYPKCTYKNTSSGLPRHALSFKFNWSWKIRVCKNFHRFHSFFFSSFSSSSRPWHSLTHCISKYYELSHKRSLNQFPYGLSVLHVFPCLLSFNSYYFFFPSVFTLLPSTLPSVAVVETHVDSFVLISIILLLVVFYFIMNCWTSTIYSFLQSMWRSRQVPQSWHCKLKAQFQLQYPWLKLLKCIPI